MVSRLPRWVWAGGAILAFAAGMVNVIAYLGFTHKAATHVTGIFSFFSIASYDGDLQGLAETFTILLSFFSGAALSGMIIGDGHLQMGRRYGVALMVECALLMASTYGFVRASMWGEYFAAMAAGLQNALASTYSGTMVRTTHLTGVLTDLGELIGKKLRGTAIDHPKLNLLSIIVLAFTAGGVGGTAAFGHLRELAMLVPAAIIGSAALGYGLMRDRLSRGTS